MRIERQDKQSEPRSEEIQRDWRNWAKLHNYVQQQPLLVETGALRVTLEVWKAANGEDKSGLIYLPTIPHTKSEDVLYIADNLNEMIATVKTLVVGSLAMVQIKGEQREERSRLN